MRPEPEPATCTFPLSERTVTHRYEDPLDRVWLTTAARIGLSVTRSPHVFASTDGRGTLALGTDDTLDADDCLAQMIFHELCHSLVEGPESFERPDWGLENEDDRDLVREHGCLRAQALLAGRYGLREVLAPTTDHRAFYDALPADPLAGDARDRSITLARAAVSRAERWPWAPHLLAALEATAAMAQAARPYAVAGSLWERTKPRPAPHPSGLPSHSSPPERTCHECAWARPGRTRPRCVQAERAVDPSWPACERFEPALDCQSCGACCREAYDVVELGPRDPFAKRHPELLARRDGRLVLARVDGRCPLLEGEGPFACRHYDDRPRTCRELERGSPNCRDARRRLGMSF